MTTKIDNPNSFPRYKRDFNELEPVGSNSNMKTLGNTDVNRAKKNVKDIVVFGDGDLFQLLSKASSEKEGWMKSTKCMPLPHGVLIQVTTQQRGLDGTYAVAEALQFVPGVKLKSNANGKKLVAI